VRELKSFRTDLTHRFENVTQNLSLSTRILIILLRLSSATAGGVSFECNNVSGEKCCKSNDGGYLNVYAKEGAPGNCGALMYLVSGEPMPFGVYKGTESEFDSLTATLETRTIGTVRKKATIVQTQARLC
jgi:hypothetical protein